MSGVVLVAAVLSCFSERGPLDPVTGDDCAVPFDVVRRGDVVVFIRQQQFVPAEASVRPGQSVTWINCEDEDADAHTSTATGGAWESPLLRSGERYTTSFTTRGEFSYTCLPHPHMRGTIRVE